MVVVAKTVVTDLVGTHHSSPLTMPSGAESGQKRLRLLLRPACSVYRACETFFWRRKPRHVIVGTDVAWVSGYHRPLASAVNPRGCCRLFLHSSFVSKLGGGEEEEEEEEGEGEEERSKRRRAVCFFSHALSTAVTCSAMADYYLLLLGMSEVWLIQ